MQDFGLNVLVSRYIMLWKDFALIFDSIITVILAIPTIKDLKEKGKIGTRILVIAFLCVMINVVSAVLNYSQCFNLEDVFEDGYYFGETINGKADGKGKQYNTDKGLIYEGRFSRNFYEGEGKWYVNYRDEDDKWIRYLRYEGEFSEGLYNGYGTLYRVGLEYDAKEPVLEYQGEFIDNVYNGQGISYELPDEKGRVCRYEGTFLDGEYHGEGEYYIDDKLVYKGTYEYGIPWGLGECYIYTKTGNTFKYDGEFWSGMPDGYGRIFVNDELIYEGGFYRGAIQGEGRVFLNGVQVEQGYFSKSVTSGTLDFFLINDAVNFFNGGFSYQTE